MDVTSAILAVSLILNILLILGIPAGVGIRALLLKRMTWAIGLNGPVDIRRVKPRGGRIVRRTDKGDADIELDYELVKTTTEGQAIVFYDQATMQQVAPFTGKCENDEDELVFTDERGIVHNLGVRWRRISGYFLNSKRMGHNMDKIAGEDTGLFGFLGRAMPMLVLLALVLIVGLMFMVGSGMGGGSA